MRTAAAVIGTVVLLTVGQALPAVAQAPGPRDPTKPCPGQSGSSCGDHYLEGVTINRPDGRLRSSGDTVDTSGATTQADLFVPGGNAIGVPEPTSCQGTGYGKTVWYDFVPHVDGDVLLQASATFDSVISIVRFSRRTARPLGSFQCANTLATSLEQARITSVRRGRAYSVQVGGVGNTGGVLDFDLNFTPYRVRARPRLAFQLTPGGVRLVNLRVNAARRPGAGRPRVVVRCRPGCGRQVKRGHRTSFRRLRGRRLRAGGRLVISVKRRGEIGAHFVYEIRRGKLPVQVKRCLQPGSRKPRKRCV